MIVPSLKTLISPHSLPISLIHFSKQPQPWPLSTKAVPPPPPLFCREILSSAHTCSMAVRTSMAMSCRSVVHYLWQEGGSIVPPPIPFWHPLVPFGFGLPIYLSSLLWSMKDTIRNRKHRMNEKATRKRLTGQNQHRDREGQREKQKWER